MIVKIKDKEFSFDGYVQPLQSIQQLAEKAYQQGRADGFDEYKNKLIERLIPHIEQLSSAKDSETYLAITEIAEKLKENN